MKITPWHLWVKLVLSKDSSRMHITLPWILDGWLYGTDGHRLHRIKTRRKNCRLDELFCAMKSKSDGNELVRPVREPPNVERIFEPLTDGSNIWEEIAFKDLEVVPSDAIYSWDEDVPIHRMDYVVLKNAKFKFNYIFEAFAGSESMMYLKKPGEFESLFLRSLDGQREAVIMPTR